MLSFIKPSVGMRTSIMYHPSVEKAIDNLRAMGLTVEVLPDGENRVFIFIKLDSVLKLIERRISKTMGTIKFRVTYEPPFIVIFAWRSES